MKIIGDLHIHSRFSRATSKAIDIKNLEKYARIKGINLLGTGDCIQPSWFKEIKQELTEDERGILRTKTGFPFIWQTEISLMYTQDGKSRKTHHIIIAPDGEVVKQISDALLKRGRIDYDGRPIFGFSSIELVEMMMSISKEIEIIPAHAFTPFFGILGSKSGFDSIKECFKDKMKYIHAIETGLSSDPPMNWRISELDNITLISNSDLHSFWPWRMGREANVFEMKEVSYKNILAAIREKKGFVETMEFFPEEGKYHYSGHRNCNVCLSPKEAKQVRGICPKCGRKLTIGVADRVEELADRPEGFRPKNAVPYKNLIPLSELIAGITKSTVSSKKVWIEYNKLIEAFGNEMNVLIETPESDLSKVTSEKISNIIIKNRNQKIPFKAGCDGVYGKPIFDNEKSQKEEATSFKSQQKGISNFL